VPGTLPGAAGARPRALFGTHDIRQLLRAGAFLEAEQLHAGDRGQRRETPERDRESVTDAQKRDSGNRAFSALRFATSLNTPAFLPRLAPTLHQIGRYRGGFVLRNGSAHLGTRRTPAHRTCQLPRSECPASYLHQVGCTFGGKWKYTWVDGRNGSNVAAARICKSRF
jgi:hypothetical protein